MVWMGIGVKTGYQGLENDLQGMGAMQGYKIAQGMREQINVISRGYGSVGRTWRVITSNVSKKTVLLEYLVDMEMGDMRCITGNQNMWGVKRGMKACARYEGAMLVRKYMESNWLRRLRLYRLKVANCLRHFLRSLAMACRMLVRPYNERQLSEPPGEVIELICCLHASAASAAAAAG